MMLEKVQDVSQDMVDVAKKMWFASVGAVLVLEEKGMSLYDEMLRKGAQVEEERLAPVASVADTMKTVVKKTTDAFDEIGKEVDSRMTSAMQRVGIPSRNEIATLTDRVEALNASIEKMKFKSRSPKSAPAAGSSARRCA